jgi:hypothetical protein
VDLFDQCLAGKVSVVAKGFVPDTNGLKQPCSFAEKVSHPTSILGSWQGRAHPD